MGHEALNLPLEAGIENPGEQRQRGAPEKPNPAGAFQSGEGRNRTGDTAIFSRVLYQLSYLAVDRKPLEKAEVMGPTAAYLTGEGRAQF
jgi:hypothetical protein